MIFTSWKEIGPWVERYYSPGKKVRIATFNYYLGITNRDHLPQNEIPSNPRRFLQQIDKKDLQLLVGVPNPVTPELRTRYITTEKILDLEARYVWDNHFKMIGIGNQVLVGGLNLSSSTAYDAMFHLPKKSGALAIQRFKEIWKFGDKYDPYQQVSIGPLIGEGLTFK